MTDKEYIDSLVDQSRMQRDPEKSIATIVRKIDEMISSIKLIDENVMKLREQCLVLNENVQCIKSRQEQIENMKWSGRRPEWLGRFG